MQLIVLAKGILANFNSLYHVRVIADQTRNPPKFNFSVVLNH
ncbi:hypothetical protein BDGGKGIB_02937 [Nodularia sphaerocarpa UHCC 0038]|nr:hypothetical protein BDGGKGIB_02937 [Nodularia sphaerocarpa UHCC 0038]